MGVLRSRPWLFFGGTIATNGGRKNGTGEIAQLGMTRESDQDRVCCLLQEPTSISYWFLQYKMALGRFSSNCFLHGFGVQKTYQKPLKNDVRTLTKSIPKTCCFSTSIFSGFGFDFGGSWASKMEPSWLLKAVIQS